MTEATGGDSFFTILSPAFLGVRLFSSIHWHQTKQTKVAAEAQACALSAQDTSDMMCAEGSWCAQGCHVLRPSSAGCEGLTELGGGRGVLWHRIQHPMCWISQNRTEDKISSFSRMKLSKNLLWTWRALPQGYVRYRLLSFMFCSVVVERENCRKGQNRMMYIFPNLLSFQQALRPVPGIAAALQPMGRWCPAAMCAFAAVRLGLFHRAKPQQLFFETPQYKRTKKKIPYWSTFRFIFCLSVAVICTVLLAPGYLHHAGTKKWRKGGGCLALWWAALPDRINSNLQNCCDSYWNVIPLLKHLLWG